MPRAVAEVLIHHVAVAVVAGEELAALETDVDVPLAAVAVVGIGLAVGEEDGAVRCS